MLVSATRSEVEPHDNEERVRRGLSRAHDLLPPKQNPAKKNTNTARVSRFLISQLFLSGHPARIGYWSWFRNQGACVPSVSTETGLMLKGLNSGRCDWMAPLAGLQTPASQDGQDRPEGMYLASLAGLNPLPADPTQPPGAAEAEAAAQHLGSLVLPGPTCVLEGQRLPRIVKTLLCG